MLYITIFFCGLVQIHNFIQKPGQIINFYQALWGLKNISSPEMNVTL